MPINLNFSHTKIFNLSLVEKLTEGLWAANYASNSVVDPDPELLFRIRIQLNMKE